MLCHNSLFVDKYGNNVQIQRTSAPIYLTWVVIYLMKNSKYIQKDTINKLIEKL